MRVVGLEPQGLFEVGFGPNPISLAGPHGPEIVVGLGQRGFLLQYLLELFGCLRELALLRVDGTQLEPGLHQIGIEAYRAPKLLGGLIEPALALEDASQIPERDGVVRP